MGKVKITCDEHRTKKPAFKTINLEVKIGHRNNLESYYDRYNFAVKSLKDYDIFYDETATYFTPFLVKKGEVISERKYTGEKLLKLYLELCFATSPNRNFLIENTSILHGFDTYFNNVEWGCRPFTLKQFKQLKKLIELNNPDLKSKAIKFMGLN